MSTKQDRYCIRKAPHANLYIKSVSYSKETSYMFPTFQISCNKSCNTPQVNRYTKSKVTQCVFYILPSEDCVNQEKKKMSK